MVANPIARLRRAGEKLQPKVRAEVLALGTTAIEGLLDVLEEDLGNWPSIHAADLLVDLKATDAIEPMLLALTETDFDDILYSRIVLRLPELGAAVLEPALAALAVEGEEGDGEDDTIHGLCEVLATLGIRDERIFEALRQVFERDMQFGAGMLASYGDPRALSLIEEAIANFEPDFTQRWSRSELVELLDAQERLGGVLAPDVRERHDGWFAKWDARHRPVREISAPVQRRKGPAQQMAEYARPILDATDGSSGAAQRALNMAMLFWNLAMRDEAKREQTLAEMVLRLDEADRAEFAETARMMIERHRTMFPEMHGGSAALLAPR